MKTFPLYVANRPEQPNDSLAVADKYSGEIAARVALADPATIERTIAAAAAAVPAMRAFPAYKRRDVLAHAARRFEERADELARWLAIEAGKPIRDSRGEVQRLVDTFRVAAEETTRPTGEVLNLEISARAAGTRGMTRRVPVGAVSLVTPFNFPLNLVAHKVAPAIAAGCPFVLKPSERTPVGAALIGEILAETDLPSGAFSVVPCLLEHVAPFIEDPRFALLSFTGSDKVGWALKARAGKKKVVLELGGNAAVIVDGDQAPKLDKIAPRIAFGAFYQSGQSCISVQRIYAHEAIHDGLRERLVAEAKKWTLGDPKDEATMLGPLIDETSARKLEGWIARAVEHGARILTGGHRQGTMMEATILADVPAGEPILDEEAFGPVAIVNRVHDCGEAFTKVNASRFGLQAGLFTDGLATTLAAWDTLEVGGVIVGDVPSFRVDSMPYGGVKDSGLGREGIRWAMADMTEERLLVLRG